MAKGKKGKTNTSNEQVTVQVTEHEQVTDQVEVTDEVTEKVTEDTENKENSDSVSVDQPDEDQTKQTNEDQTNNDSDAISLMDTDNTLDNIDEASGDERRNQELAKETPKPKRPTKNYRDMHLGKNTTQKQMEKQQERLESKRENHELQARIKVLENKLKRANKASQEQAEMSEKRIKHLESQNEKMVTQLLEKSRKIDELKEEISRKNQTIKNQEADKHDKAETKLKLHMIGDSNCARIEKQLDKEQNLQITRTFAPKTQNLKHAIEDDVLKIKEANYVIIHVGTNNTRNGQDNVEDCAEQIADAVEQILETGITPKQIILMQPPPTRQDRITISTMETILAVRIQDITKMYKNRIIKNTEMVKAIDNGEEIWEDDGYHLNTHTSKKMARIITEEIDNQDKDKKVRDNNGKITVTIKGDQTKKNTIEIDQQHTKHIIGHRGKNIRDIEEKTETRITTQDNRGKTTITIEGKNKEQIEKAEKIMETKLKEVEEFSRYKGKHQERRTTCRYYQQGYCKYGNECYYIHKETTEERRTDRTNEERNSRYGREREQSRYSKERRERSRTPTGRRERSRTPTGRNYWGDHRR